MRAYLRVDPNLAERKSDYPDGAFRAYLECLCYAEQQPKRGRFRNKKLLAVLLEKRSRWIPLLIQRGDLVELASGALYVDGWDEWQEGDVTVSERMRRLRSRRRDVTPTDTPTVTVPTVTVPYSGGGGGKHLAEAVGGSPSREPANGANAQSTTGTLMGFRPRASVADIARQEAEQWSKCSDCGVLGRNHPSSGDHPFRAAAGVGT